MNEQFWWFLSRASGIVAWGLLCATIVWGILLSTRLMRQVDRPAWLLDLHKWFAALSIAGVAIHLAALVADSYVEFGWRELAIPMASTWQPGPVAWGIIATYFLIVIQLTSLLMKKLPRRFWYLITLVIALTVVRVLYAMRPAKHERNPGSPRSTPVAASEQ